MNQQPEQEPADDNSASLMRQRYAHLSAALEILPTAQIEIYLHEVERIIKQLEEIPQRGDGQARHEQMYQQLAYLENDIFTTHDALVLEKAKRSLLSLQGLILDSGKARTDRAMNMVMTLCSMPSSPDERQESDTSVE